MSSTNKTNNLRLNKWVGTDKPQRTDFNADNEIIDSAISEHNRNTEVHITEEEREKWNSFTQMGVYYGNGSAERVIQLNSPYPISMVMVFANNRPISVTYFSNGKKSNYIGFATKTSNSIGIRLNDDFNSITVKQESSALLENEYAALNESGVAYNYIMFR